jgi:hypothetical protein
VGDSIVDSFLAGSSIPQPAKQDSIAASFVAGYGKVKRYPGDPISKIEERKAHPPPNARGSVAPSESLGLGGAIRAGLKGVGADPEAMIHGLSGLFAGESDTEKEQLGLGDVQAPTGSPADVTPTKSGSAKEASSFAGTARRVAQAPTRTGKIAAASGFVPLAGDIAGGVLQPAVALSENRPVTPEENEAMISSAVMAGTILTPAALRMANVMRARGVTPEAAATEAVAAPPEQPAEPAATLTDSQLDRLKTDTQLGNRARLPQKLSEALTNGEVEPDDASLRAFLAENPDVVDEVQQGYEMPEVSPEVSDDDIMAAAEPSDAEILAEFDKRRGDLGVFEFFQKQIETDRYRRTPEAAIERETLPLDEFVKERFPKATLTPERDAAWTQSVLSETAAGVPGFSIEPAPDALKAEGIDRQLVYRDPDGRPIGVANVVDGEGAEAPLVRDFAVDKSQGLLAGRAAGAIATELERAGAFDHMNEISPDAARFVQKAEARRARMAAKESPKPPEDGGDGGDDSGGGSAPPPLHSDAANPIPSPSDIAGVAKKFAPFKEMMDAAAPASASPEAAGAADILRKSKAEIANDATIERVRNKEIAKAFDRAGDESNIANISEYERTGQFADAPPGYSEMYRETTDAAHESLQQTYGDDRVGYVENYVRRAFKFGSAADEAKATGVLSNWIQSLSASRSPLKGRTLGVPLDEALNTMRAAGIEVRPASTNPEILRQWTIENANQARVYKQAWADAKQSKLIQYVRQGERIPEGLIELDDRVAKTFRPTSKGMVQTGRYFAEPGVARIFNNAISKGLGGSPTFRAIRALNNSYNQMQLGLSAFHLTGTAINAGISDLSLGLQQLIQGDVSGGAKSIARSAAPGLSFARDLYHGRAFINDLVAGDPAARAILSEQLNPAGGRLAVDQSYRNAATENMNRAWSNGRYLRALGNAPLAIIQKIASPLMDYAIPRVKIGAFLDLADAQRQRLPLDASPTEIHRAYQQAWDSIDNRFGQLVHDNLFWDRTAADLAQVGTRSVGWNLGTIRELGGGAVDLMRGNLTPRTLYSFALPVYAGLIGAVYLFLHAGKYPQTLRDYYYPANGLTDSKGRADRVTLPTYMKDVFAYTDHPVTTLEHKASPLVSLAFDLGTNRDYFGDMIRNPDDTRARQLMQDGAYALKQFQPFSVQQAAKTWEEGGPLYAGEQFMGFVKAPNEMKQTSEESDAARERRRQINDEKMRRAAERHGR